MSRVTLAAAVFCLACGAVAPPAAGLVLVENGVSRAPVVVFEGAPPFTRRAADELAGYLEKISGARPPVLEGRPDPLPEHAIWVGWQPVLGELFPGVDFDFQHPEEILIAVNDNHLVIAGRDRWDPDHLLIELPGNWRLPEHGRVYGRQQEYGTVNAVYSFLQDHLDVRWLWPGEEGEDIVRRDTVALETFEYRYHPRFRGREGIFTIWRVDRQKPNPAQDWVRFQRVLLDSLELPGGHGFGAWWHRWHETHPEFFALQPDGTRGGGEMPYPSAENVKMCKSNPALHEQWVAEVAAALERDPTRRVFNASAGDGFRSGYCVCENCRAWDRLDGESYAYTWQGISQEYVAMTDRQVTFANTLARLLKERFPDRELYVLIMAYGPSQPVPVAAVPDDNVIVSGVFSFHKRKWTGAPGRSDPAMLHRERFLAWGEVAPNFAWRPNLGFGPSWARGLPEVAPRDVIRDFRLVAENHVISIFFDMVWGHWATHGPHYYMLAQMAWNPFADGEAILEDYYRRGFGPASGELKRYWDMMAEAAARVTCEELPLAAVYDEAFLERAAGHLARADELLADQPEVYRRRVGFVRVGLDYTRALLEAMAHMERFQASGGQDRAAEDAARATWLEKIWPLATSTEYPYALNALHLRPGHQRAMSGLYPADLDRRW